MQVIARSKAFFLSASIQFSLQRVLPSAKGFAQCKQVKVASRCIIGEVIDIVLQTDVSRTHASPVNRL